MCRMQARGLQSCFVFFPSVLGEAKVKLHPLICHKKEVEMGCSDAYDYPFKTERRDLQLHGSCYIMYM